MKYAGRWLGRFFLALAGMIVAVWAFGAVWFDAPFENANKATAALCAIAFAAAFVLVRPFWRKAGYLC